MNKKLNRVLAVALTIVALAMGQTARPSYTRRRAHTRTSSSPTANTESTGTRCLRPVP